MVQHATYGSLEDALRAADYGLLYVYVSPSADEGWFSTMQCPDFQWYEKLVVVDQEESRGFLQDAGADEPFALIGVHGGFIAFVARNAEELVDMVETVRPWVDACIKYNIERGVIDPRTYRVPG
jgi:hypothetical protein